MLLNLQQVVCWLQYHLPLLPLTLSREIVSFWLPPIHWKFPVINEHEVDGLWLEAEIGGYLFLQPALECMVALSYRRSIYSRLSILSILPPTYILEPSTGCAPAESVLPIRKEPSNFSRDWQFPARQFLPWVHPLDILQQQSAHEPFLRDDVTLKYTVSIH